MLCLLLVTFLWVHLYLMWFSFRLYSLLPVLLSALTICFQILIKSTDIEADYEPSENSIFVTGFCLLSVLVFCLLPRTWGLTTYGSINHIVWWPSPSCLEVGTPLYLHLCPFGGLVVILMFAKFTMYPRPFSSELHKCLPGLLSQS